MPMEPETKALIPDWNTRKLAQWQRIAGHTDALPGLQLIRHGEGRSSFMLVCSTPEFYEAVLIGQLPQIEVEAVKPEGRNQPTRRRPVPEHKKRLERRSIDLCDDEIDQVIACWANAETALDLPFVMAVWGRDGQPVTKARIRAA